MVRKKKEKKKKTRLFRRRIVRTLSIQVLLKKLLIMLKLVQVLVVLKRKSLVEKVDLGHHHQYSRPKQRKPLKLSRRLLRMP
jgi:hypothetical protein